MPVTEAIILAGGLGTRLREAVPDLPKCMAPVNGHPFIYYVISHLQKQGITKFIFSLGYRSDAFIDFLSQTLNRATYELVIENEPLGTGGAIQFACKKATTQQVAVLNGDSLFTVDITQLFVFHQAHQAACSLALKPMENFERYGVVELNDDDSVAVFKEKQSYSKGLINGGVYIIDIPLLLDRHLPEKFSFETDYLQAFHQDGKIFGMIQDGYFIDIGVPADYLKAQQDLY